jgi:hypothetical protein
MGLVRTALVFGAGYVLGRPEGRRQLTELARRPEVTHLRQQAVDKVSTTVDTGRKRLTKDTKEGKHTDPTSDGVRNRRLPSFPRRGARSTVPAGAAPTTDTLSTGTPSTDALSTDAPSTDAVSTDVLSSDALFTDTRSTGSGSTGPGVPPVPPAPHPR